VLAVDDLVALVATSRELASEVHLPRLLHRILAEATRSSISHFEGPEEFEPRKPGQSVAHPHECYDTVIEAGESWKQAIDSAIEEASVALFLVNPSLLASAFVMREELAPVLQSRPSDRAPATSHARWCVQGH
jgi:hypothetical protein